MYFKPDQSSDTYEEIITVFAVMIAAKYATRFYGLCYTFYWLPINISWLWLLGLGQKETRWVLFNASG